MIQDIAPHRFENQYHPAIRPDMESLLFLFSEDGRLFCSLKKETEGGQHAAELCLPRVSDLLFAGILSENEASEEKLTYLFRLDGVSCFLLRTEVACEGEALKEKICMREARCTKEKIRTGGGSFSYQTLQALRDEAACPRHLVFAAVTARHLWNWYRNNRFCGRCGGKTVHDAKERALFCPHCKSLVYPRIVPAVIVGVLSGGRILVTKYRTGFPHYALVAGFTEIGETLEETVAREVLEETGLRVKNIRYYKSQPWGIADDILAGFFCDADGSTEIHLDENELRLAQWKTREELALQPDDFSLTNEMMRQFKEGLVR